MLDSVGRKLNQARQKRELSIEEVAHITKLRPDKIVALESDDYSSFPSNAYAKGFLQIYARFLRVDVSEFLPSLDSSNSISVDDYQYLSNAPTPKHSEPERRRDRSPPSVAPLIFFILVVIVGLGVMWLITNYQRTLPSSHTSDTEDSSAKSQQGASPSPANADAAQAAPEKPVTPDTRPIPAGALPPTATPLAAGVPSPTSTPAPHPSLSARSSPAPLTGAMVPETSPFASPAAAPTPRTGSSILTDHDFISPTPVTTPDLSATSSPRSGLNEVLVASLKKTWVTIRRDDPKATPIFEDYIYPNANPLKLKGARFFISARDPGSVQITKNGLPFAYPEANAPVE